MGDRRGEVLLDSNFSPIFFPSLQEYKRALPRRKLQRSKDRCCGFSTTSWFFLLFALLQVVLVTGLQVAISILGRGRLDQYVECLEESLQNSIPDIVEVDLTNTTLPTFGEDKEIYVFFFIFLALYNFFLVSFALKFQNIIEVYSFLVVNILIMVYAFFQVYQFRGFGSACDEITMVGSMALVNAILLLIFTIIFLVFSLFIYVEFGWKTYVLVDCNPAMRYYYRVYQIFMSVLKLVLVFLVIFSIGQCVLILNPSNYEFPLTILIALAAVLALPVIYFLVTSESIVGAMLILVTGVLLVGYFIFKTYRYAARTCPLCRQQTNQTQEMQMEIEDQILANNPGINGTQELDLSTLDRAQDFGHLIMIAVVNLIFTLVAIAVFIHYLRQYKKGLKEYFAERNKKLLRNLLCWRRESYDQAQTPTINDQ